MSDPATGPAAPPLPPAKIEIRNLRKSFGKLDVLVNAAGPRVLDLLGRAGDHRDLDRRPRRQPRAYQPHPVHLGEPRLLVQPPPQSLPGHRHQQRVRPRRHPIEGS